MADIDGEEHGTSGMWTRGLLIRRNIADGERAFFSTWYPVGAGIDVLVAIEGHRWATEDSFETAKNELGLDHNESRSWHRQVSLVMLTFAMMATIRHRANLLPASQTARRASHAVRHSSVGRSRKSAVSPRAVYARICAAANTGEMLAPTAPSLEDFLSAQALGQRMDHSLSS